MYDLIRRARAGENNPWMRRRLELSPEQRDFLALEEFFAEGATDYYGQLFIFGDRGDPSQGTGVVYSFAVDRRGGFNDDDTSLLQATLPALSLAMKAHASYVIASTRCIAEWRHRVISRWELMSLSDRELSDIGLTPMDRYSERSKPFWQA